MNRNIKTVFVATLVAAAASTSAFAHAHLKSSNPPVNGAVTKAPHEIDLHFTEGLNLAFTGITLKGPHDAAIKTGKAHLKTSDDKALIVPLAKPLKPGTYQVAWHALSRDGHKTKGHFHFTVKRH